MAARKKTPRRRRRAPAPKAKPRRKRVRRAAPASAARARGRKPKRALPAEPKPAAATRRGPRAGSKLRKRASRPRAAAAPPAGGGPDADGRGFAASLALLASEPVRAGVVRHHFPRAGVARVSLELPLARGERIHVLGATSDFLAEITSLRVDGSEAPRAGPGEATLALPERARPGDVVYVLRPPT